eukprot:8333436-Alexandrium_andersonii.AAC.1
MQAAGTCRIRAEPPCAPRSMLTVSCSQHIKLLSTGTSPPCRRGGIPRGAGVFEGRQCATRK